MFEISLIFNINETYLNLRRVKMKYFCLLLIAISMTTYSYDKVSVNDEVNRHIAHDLELLGSIKQHRQSVAQGAFILVGAEPNGCDFDSIQDAIDSATQSGIEEIRIATNKSYVENLLIDNINVTLVGGYNDCFNAGLGGPGNTQVDIDGSNTSAPVLRLTGSSQRNTVVLKNLSFKNGVGTGLQSGGGINAFDANAEVMLDNVDISSNSGGGIAILGGTTTNTDMVLINTLIFNNTNVSTGAGIYCEGSDASIALGEDSGIVLNQLSSPFGKGAGAYIAFECQFSMYSSSMNSNTAKDDGGGLYVGSGARANLIGRKICNGNDCIGDDIRPVRFNNNIADSDSSAQGNGGAIFVEHATTVVSMSQVWIDDNSAFQGGAIAVELGAFLSIDRIASNCWNSHINDKCNLLESNFASSISGNGGAIYNNDSQVIVNRAYLENNRADFGTAIYSIGNSAVTVVEGSVFNNNGNNGVGGFSDIYVARATAGAELLVLYSTFADNHSQLSVFGISNLNNSVLTLKRSIIHDQDTGTVLNDNPGTTSFDCILAHEINSISGNQLFFGDPGFIDRANGDYHLGSGSSAIDLCVDTGSGNSDVDNDFRGYDDPTVENQGNDPNAKYDAGADETYATDIFFKNSFE